MRHIIDLSDLTDKEFNDLYKLTTNIIDRPEGYVDACRGKVLGSLFYEPRQVCILPFRSSMRATAAISIRPRRWPTW